MLRGLQPSIPSGRTLLPRRSFSAFILQPPFPDEMVENRTVKLLTNKEEKSFNNLEESTYIKKHVLQR